MERLNKAVSKVETLRTVIRDATDVHILSKPRSFGTACAIAIPLLLGACAQNSNVQPSTPILRNPVDFGLFERNIAYCPGGEVEGVIKSVEDANAVNARVRIKSDVYSACIIYLSAHNLCISPKISFNVHEARRVKGFLEYNTGTRDETATRLMESHVPKCARDLFESKRAFGSGKFTEFPGEKILEACPQIHTCGN